MPYISSLPPSGRTAEGNIIIGENVEPRLISSISRTGRVIFQDDFEGYTAVITEKWQNQSDGTGSIALDTANPFRGKSCAKLLTQAAAAKYSAIQKYQGALPKGKMGLEFWFMSLSGVANVRSIEIYIDYYDGTNRNRAAVKWLGTVTTLQQKWQYFTSAGAFADITGGAHALEVESTNQVWHHVKLIVDESLIKYGSLICDALTLNISTLGLNVAAAAATLPQIQIWIRVTAETATADALYIDDLIWTDQE